MAASIPHRIGMIQCRFFLLSLFLLVLSLTKLVNTPTGIPGNHGKFVSIEYGIPMSPSIDPGIAQSISVKVNLTLDSLALDKPSRPRCHLVILLSLVVSGQVEVNPGPNIDQSVPLDPCGVCDANVDDHHKALLCDDCQAWYHNSCTGISIEQYDDLLNYSNFSWKCVLCDSVNFHSAITGVSLESLSSVNTFDLLDGLDYTSFTPMIHSSPEKKIPNLSHRSTNNRILKGLAVNCNSLISVERRSLFGTFIDQNQPDIIFGSESKLDTNIPTYYSVFPPNYSVHRYVNSM